MVQTEKTSLSSPLSVKLVKKNLSIFPVNMVKLTMHSESTSRCASSRSSVTQESFSPLSAADSDLSHEEATSSGVSSISVHSGSSIAAASCDEGVYDELIDIETVKLDEDDDEEEKIAVQLAEEEVQKQLDASGPRRSSQFNTSGVSIDRRHVCNVCGKGFPYLSILESHKRSHTGEKPFACHFCDKKFAQKATLQVHERTHTGERPYKCKYCEKTFAQYGTKTVHERSAHLGIRNYKCPKCNKCLSSPSALYTHKKTHGEKVFKCHSCPKTFTLKNYLKLHVKQVHEQTERKHVCKFCGKSFAYAGSLQVHVRTHTGERPYVCKYCPKAFASQGNLQSHERTHTGERPYTCNHCGRSFIQKSQLTAHEATHSTNGNTQVSLDENKPSVKATTQTNARKVSEYVCKFCGKRYAYASSLYVHTRLHTGERPFRCQFCDKTFTNQGNMQVHQRVHTGEKPYKCEACNKCYAQKVGLKIHQEQCQTYAHLHRDFVLTNSTTDSAYSDTDRFLQKIEDEAFHFEPHGASFNDGVTTNVSHQLPTSTMLQNIQQHPLQQSLTVLNKPPVKSAFNIPSSGPCNSIAELFGQPGVSFVDNQSLPITNPQIQTVSCDANQSSLFSNEFQKSTFTLVPSQVKEIPPSRASTNAVIKNLLELLQAQQHQQQQQQYTLAQLNGPLGSQLIQNLVNSINQPLPPTPISMQAPVSNLCSLSSLLSHGLLPPQLSSPQPQHSISTIADALAVLSSFNSSTVGKSVDLNATSISPVQTQHPYA